MVRTWVLAFSVSIFLSSTVWAQDNGPVIVPERIQKLASESPVAERLGIKWEAAAPDDIGRYMGLLAAANEVAISIARQNDRDTPSDEDYQAALAALCLWPTNKPKIAEPYWSKAFAAFGNQSVRTALQGAVGPFAVDLPASIASGQGSEDVLTKWPSDTADYFTKVLDFGKIE